MSWPRGSNIRLVRIQSKRARKSCRRSNMVAPVSCGIEPPVTTRTGLPQVWPSMQVKVVRAIGHPGASSLLQLWDGAAKGATAQADGTGCDGGKAGAARSTGAIGGASMTLSAITTEQTRRPLAT